MRILLGKDLSGPAGRAQEVIVRPEKSDPIDQNGTVGAWFLTCPKQSPFWDHYLLAAVHLRPIPGGRPIQLKRPGATHEITLVALDPTYAPQPEVLATWNFLTPLNFNDQVILPGDIACLALLDDLAKAVTNGVLWAEPPLSGQLEPWQTIMQTTAAHHRGEH